MTRQRALTAYILLIAVLAAGVLAYCGALIARMTHGEQTHWLPYALVLLAITWICSRQQVYFTDSSVVAMGTIGQIACVLLLPAPIAVVTVGAAKVFSEIYLVTSGRGRRSWRSPVVNVAKITFSIGAAVLLFNILSGPKYLWSPDGAHVLLGFPAVLAVALAYHVVDVSVVSGAVMFTARERLNSIFSQIITYDTLLPEISMIFVGIVFAVLFKFSPVLSLFIVVPVYLSMRSFGAVARMQNETLEAVLKMAESIDMRDTGTAEHSKRLAQYARDLAESIGLTPEHVNEVGLAARTHDLGKIEISDAILLKPGPLTTDERTRMEEHPVIGAEMLSSYLAFQKSVDFVKHSHERWDGKGYPDGLKGEEIPLGSRIILVVDAYDAMREDRPYRAGMPVGEAVKRLKDGMGSQFDPTICAKWIQLLIEKGEFQPEADRERSLRILSDEAG